MDNPLRVTLFHNPDAGFEQCSTAGLLQLLCDRGFDAVARKPDDGAGYTHDEIGDIAVIAGGDGTIGAIAKELSGAEIPIAILPQGTANNIANSLGIKGELSDIVSRWDPARRKSFDVGRVFGPEGGEIFLESAGFGVFPKLIRQHEDRDEKEDSREEEIAKALENELDILRNYVAHHCEINIDGEILRGRFIMVELMNIRFAGPNMCLAPLADPGDGLLDVTIVREEQRSEMIDFLSRCFVSKEVVHGFHTRRVRSLSVEWHGAHYHIDDKAYENAGHVRLGVEVVPNALEFLTI